MTDTHSAIVITLAGIALFIHGMGISSKNLQKLTSNQVRDYLTQLGNKKFLAVGVGFLLTIMIQSSAAITSILVGLGSAGAIKLRQVIALILGTVVGSTLTVQLLSLNIAHYGMPLFIFGFVVSFFSERRVFKRSAKVVMGFGLLFWGLEIITIGTSGLKDLEFFVNSLNYLKENPLAAIFITSVFTAVVHSSAVVIGFAMALATSGLINFETSIYFVYGANIGTTAIAIIASMGGNAVGRQIAWAHFLFKFLGVVLFASIVMAVGLPFADWTTERAIANVHTLLNVFILVAFFPFTKQSVKLVKFLFPPSKSEKEFGAKFLVRGGYQSQHVILAHASREALRMCDIVYKMVKDSILLFEKDDEDLKSLIRKNDNQVDLLNREIKLYLAHHMENTEEDISKNMMRLMTFVTDFEGVADVVDNSILELSKKKHALKLEFSDSGWEDLRNMHENLVHMTTLSITAFQTQSDETSTHVIELKRIIRNLEQSYRETHLERVVQGQKQSISTSSIHLDLISEYRRASGLLANHVYGILNDNTKQTREPS